MANINGPEGAQGAALITLLLLLIHSEFSARQGSEDAFTKVKLSNTDEVCQDCFNHL